LARPEHLWFFLKNLGLLLRRELHHAQVLQILIQIRQRRKDLPTNPKVRVPHVIPLHHFGALKGQASEVFSGHDRETLGRLRRTNLQQWQRS
jgi:hypothetical protein